MKRWITALLLAAMVYIGGGLIGAQADQQERIATSGEASVCFAAEGAQDWAYSGEGLSVAIKRFAEEDVVFFVCDVQAADASHLRTALSGDAIYGRSEKTGDIAARHGAVLAINGDDYGVHKFGTIIRNGELIRAKDTTRHMLTIDKNGDFDVVIDRSEEPTALAQRLLDAGVMQAFEFGPVLVQNGEAISFDNGFKLIKTTERVREPRTGIGQLGPLHYVIIVVDGRREGYSKGMSLQEFQALFVRFGAQIAFNLDGGGSTTLIFNGELLNRPAQNAQRRVTDILMFL